LGDLARALFALRIRAGFPLSLIAGVGESNFQHYKAGFYAFLIASLLEYALARRNIQDSERFGFSQIAAIWPVRHASSLTTIDAIQFE
jgi:hypothetical protein